MPECEVLCDGVVFVDVDVGSLAMVVVSPFMNPCALKLEKAVDSGIPLGNENGDSPPKPSWPYNKLGLGNKKGKDAAAAAAAEAFEVAVLDDE